MGRQGSEDARAGVDDVAAGRAGGHEALGVGEKDEALDPDAPGLAVSAPQLALEDRNLSIFIFIFVFVAKYRQSTKAGF